jgi:3-dehydroquinate dehydratase II
MNESLALLRSGTTKWHIGMINGPNMANLNNRDPSRFGTPGTVADLEKRVAAIADVLGAELTCSIVSNHEGQILDWIHARTGDLDGLIVNPAGMTWTGEAVCQALHDSGLPAIEVHFANPSQRGKHSIFSDRVVGTCQGMRKHSYTAGLVALVGMLDDGDFTKPARYESRMSRQTKPLHS